MIDIDLLDRQLEEALTEELRAQLKPISRPPERPGVQPSSSRAAVQSPAPPARTATPRPAAPGTATPRPAAVGTATPTSRWTRPSASFAPFEKDHATEQASPPARADRGRVDRGRVDRGRVDRGRVDKDTMRAQPGGATLLGGAPPELDIEGHAQRIVNLVSTGRLNEADVHIAAHAALARDEGMVEDRRDAAAWAAMRALLDGRQADARAGTDLVLCLGQKVSDPAAADRYWQQQFWVALEWGGEDERLELLDQCRQRAYWQDDLAWRSALSLLLARMGRSDEARREFDETAGRVLNARPDAATQARVSLDITTNLAEASAYLGDARRAILVNRAVAWPKAGMVTVGRAQVCKGSIARFHALLAGTAGRWPEADSAFRTATEAHRRAGAQPLLARTLGEWGRSLTGRDDSRARHYLQESAELAGRLQLVELLPTE